MGELRTMTFYNQDGVRMVGALLPVSKLDELQITYQVLQFSKNLLPKYGGGEG
jgi:hypothetical protein